jgi:hypothetical protein
MIAVLVTAGFAGVSTAAVSSGQITKQEAGASVTFTAQTSGGTTIVVDEVTLPDGGFVTVHGGSLVFEADAFGSARGTRDPAGVAPESRPNDLYYNDRSNCTTCEAPKISNFEHLDRVYGTNTPTKDLY